MPPQDVPAFTRTTKSTALDGLDLTVEEARAMSAEEFGRLFGYAGLGEFPVVQSGVHLDRAPKGCECYVRFRPAPEKPTAKDRKQSGYELVVKAPQRALPEAGGGIAVNPKRVGLDARTADEARLEALVYLARKSGRRRRATNWPVERIQALNCSQLLDKFLEVFHPEPARREDETKKARNKRHNIAAKIRALQAAFPELEIGDVTDWVVGEYDRRAAHRAQTTRATDMHFFRFGLQRALEHIGVPPTYVIRIDIENAKRLPKVAWTPAEYDRFCASAEGLLFNPDGTPAMVDGPDGPVQAMRHRHSVASGESWRRAILFLPYTVSRHGRLTVTRWVPPEIEPRDGRPLPDRPWIEVTDEEVIYHRDGEQRYDGTKKRGPVIIPVEFAPTVREWFAADLAAGREFVFHQADGRRYAGEYLTRKAFDAIVRDAGLPARRVPHHLKDLAVQWSDSAGMDRETLATAADTSAETIERKYGPQQNVAKLVEASEEMTQSGWRKKGEKRAAIARLFEEAAGRAPAAPEAVRRRTARR